MRLHPQSLTGKNHSGSRKDKTDIRNTASRSAISGPIILKETGR
jgi:hypothetical protein